jgi:preprotein translocase subunit YajC
MGQYGSTIIKVVVLVVIFYFFLTARKQEEEKLQEMRDSLTVGDTVTTIGGIVGKVVHVLR